MEEFSVPPESGVEFCIYREEADEGICLLIHIDNQKYPLFEAEEARPDYLAIYLHGNGCICTIIEMKSKSGKNLKHGLEQIRVLSDRLKQEFQEHLPPQFRLHIQGILLCQYNADVPRVLIEKMSHQGLTILPAPCNSRAELFPYISQKNELIKGFRNKPRHPAEQSPVEALLSTASLSKRVPEPESAARQQAAPGLQISYVLSDKDEYVTLITRGKNCVFLVSEEGIEHSEQLRQDIEKNGLQQKFLVEALPI